MAKTKSVFTSSNSPVFTPSSAHSAFTIVELPTSPRLHRTGLIKSGRQTLSLSKGFTIVELLVAIVIIGILATLTIISYIGIQQKAIVASINSDLVSSSRTLKLFQVENSAYPTNISDCPTPAEGNLCLESSPGNTYLFDAINTTTPQTFCLAARNGNNKYHITEDSVPESGVCDFAFASTLTALTTSPFTIDLTWPEVDGATSYTLEQATNSSFTNDLTPIATITPPDATAFTSDGLSPNTIYYYRVNATIIDDTSEWSEPAYDTTNQLDAPDAPVITITPDNSNVLATITPVTCTGSTAQYGIRSRTNDGAWGSYSAWSTDTTSTQAASDSVKYGYQAQVRCYVSESSYSTTSEGTESTYTYYIYDSLPIATSISGYWSTAPTGYLLEDGSAVSRTTYADLFTAIGTTYGVGNGSTTFNLPDSRGRVAVNKSSDTEFDTIGEKVHTLTSAEMPSHTHSTYPAASYPAGTVGVNSGYGFTEVSLSRSSYGHALSFNGGSQPHNNIQPSIVKTFAIKYRPSTGSNSMIEVATSISGYWFTAPQGFLLEDGSAVSRTTYSDLFTIIGTTYGVGNGSTTFNLPDSRGRVAVNKSSDTEFDTIGEKYGEKVHTLTSAEMPSHTHSTYPASSYPAGTVGANSGYGFTEVSLSRSVSYTHLT